MVRRSRKEIRIAVNVNVQIPYRNDTHTFSYSPRGISFTMIGLLRIAAPSAYLLLLDMLEIGTLTETFETTRFEWKISHVAGSPLCNAYCAIFHRDLFNENIKS
jgi:hypothetical protein